MNHLVKYQQEDSPAAFSIVDSKGETVIAFTSKQALNEYVTSGDINLNSISLKPTPAKILIITKRKFKNIYNHEISSAIYNEVFGT